MKLIIEGLEKSFGDQKVLRGVNETFEKGKIYALLGRNGSGKTTFFNCVAQEMKYESGDIYLDDGTDFSNQDIGYVYSTPLLPDFMTGYEFLVFFIDINKDRNLSRHDTNYFFETINFSYEDQHKLIRDYSHGMRNKLQMLCIMILKPKVLLLDEPLVSFDVVASVEMKRLLVSLKEDCIMILSTHILQIAKELCDEVIVLHNGTTEHLSHEQLNSDSFEDDILAKLSESYGD